MMLSHISLGLLPIARTCSKRTSTTLRHIRAAGSSYTVKWLASTLLCTSLAQTCAAQEAEEFTWPDGAKAAVSLSYDDALNSQLEHVVPVLNDAGLRASFYVYVDSAGFKNQVEQWKAVAAAGHELGNHSMFHQCAKTDGRDWVKAHHDLQKISAEQMRDEIFLTNDILKSIDGQTERTYTVPCGDQVAHGKNYLPLIKEAFLGIKASGGQPPKEMHNFDRHNVAVIPVENVDHKTLIGLVEQAAANGTIANILFHGVGGDHLSVDAKEHQAFIHYLAENQDRLWVDSFVNIMRYVKDQEGNTSHAKNTNEDAQDMVLR